MKKKNMKIRDTKVLYNPTTGPSGLETSPISITYHDPELIRSLSGAYGKMVLEKLIGLLNDIINKDHWPVIKLDVSPGSDSEIEDWHYILLVITFKSDFNSADKYLHEFYNRVDSLSVSLSDKEQDFLQRMIYFDIRTAVS
jgi:hypothetical protein